ncbi:P2Y purinoceptor 4 [Mantella aurantiaca]
MISARCIQRDSSAFQPLEEAPPIDTPIDAMEDPAPALTSFHNAAAQAANVCVFNEEFKYFLLPVSYSAVFLLGLPLNLTAMWIFAAKMRPWSSTTVYMFNLALSDSLYLLSLPTLIYYYADRNNWPFGEVSCKAMRFLFYTNLYCSILFLTCISIHRYVGVCHPLLSLHRMKARYAHMLCAGVWISVSVCLIPNLLFVTVSPNGNDTICHDTTKPEDFERYVEYSTAVMSLLFGVPCLVIAGCYGMMARELMRPMVSGSRQTLPAYKRKSIKTIILVLTVFIICFLPFHVMRTVYYYARLLDANCHLLNVINLSYKITRPLASANSCFDPVLYFMASDNYQKRLVRVVTGISNMCRRHLPAIRQTPTGHKCDGPAVIPVRGAQNTGSLGNLLGNDPGRGAQNTGSLGNLDTNPCQGAQNNGSLGNLLDTNPCQGAQNNGSLGNPLGNNQEADHPDDIGVEMGTNNGNHEETSTEHVGKKAKNGAKWRFTGKNMEVKGNIGAGLAEDIGGEPRKDMRKAAQRRNVIASNDKKIVRTQSDNILERKRNNGNGEKRRYWSLRRMRGAEGSQNESLEGSSWVGDGTSSWNLLDAASQGGQKMSNEGRGKKLHFLPNI